MRTLLATISSAALTTCIIANAFYQKKQFYPSVIFITRSNSSMSVIYLQALICVLLIGKLFRFIFLGELRAAETENLIERSWHAISETCLAFTVFRDDLNPKFVALFTLLLFLKCFHWLAEDRVEFMERSPNISMLFHIRIASLLTILGLLDIMFICFAYHSTMLKGASVQLVFGFEYAILLAVVVTIIVKYSLHLYDLEQRDLPWENKGVYLLYFELLINIHKMGLYLCFIVVMAKIHSFPLFALRPMYLSVKAFQKALKDVILSRRAIRYLNTVYPSATPDELATLDNVCIICREEMLGNGSAKKLPCNHIFHVSCLRSWFQRQQTCPTCRMNILSVADRQPSPGNQQAQPPQQNQSNNNQPTNGQSNNNQANNQSRSSDSQRQPNANQMNANQFQIFFRNLNIPEYIVQDRQQQARSSSNQTTSQDAAESNNAQQNDENRHNNNTPRTIFTTPPLLMPPFMSFPFMPFLPFPMPPPNSSDSSATTSTDNQNDLTSNLSRLSEDELRRLEGNERGALEARIRFLQNLRTSIDATVLQFQQYNEMIIRTQQQASKPSSTTPSTAQSTSQSPSQCVNETDKEIKKSCESDPNVVKSDIRPKDASQSIIDHQAKENEIDQSSTVNVSAVKSEVDEESDLVRRSRLRRFNNNRSSDQSDAPSTSIKNEESQ